MNASLDVFGDALATMGERLADTAVRHAKEEENAFNQARTLLSLAQSLGMGKEAHEALYGPGEREPARKVLWCRRQKRLFNQAMELEVPILTDVSQKALMAAVYQRRELGRTEQQRQEDALRMFQRTAKGALTANVEGSTIARTLLSQAGRVYKTN